MLELLVLRHAKAEPPQPGQADHDRPLAARGRAAAPRMGRHLREQTLLPELVLCSTARRTRETWELVAAELPLSPPTLHLRDLYEATPGKLLRSLGQHGEARHRLALVGHNPGLHTLACRLLAGSAAGDAARDLRTKLPTGALAHLAFEAADWAEVSFGSGQLMAFVRPRDLD